MNSERFGNKLCRDSSESEQGSGAPRSLLALKREKHGNFIIFDAWRLPLKRSAINRTNGLYIALLESIELSTRHNFAYCLALGAIWRS